ncbi:MAG: DUF805 domain-containing protein [Bacteroidota bacterium]
MKWYIKVLTQYADFEGRARRKEYWMFFLVNLLIYFAIAFVGGLFLGFNPEAGMGSASMMLPMLYSLAVLLPSIAVGIRRLHDTGRSGWWLLISFVPVIGPIVLIVFFVQEGQPGTNQYGPNPKEVESPAMA